jgi:arylsulfatase A-like enzyme
MEKSPYHGPTRRGFLAGSAFPVAPAQPGRRPPNFLYLHSHDTGRYIQPYGSGVATPNLQRLAGGGVLFRQAFNAAPTCSPSRAALLTGQCPHSSGMLGLAHRGFSLNDYRQHIIHTLRGAGYESVLAGIQHVARDPKMIGYDRILSARSNRAADVAPAAADYLLSRPRQPFWLTVGFFETHREFPEPGQAEDARYCRPAPTVPDTPETRRDMAAFRASARIMDEAAGRVLAALEQSGLAEDTLVIYTTDHGIAFPAMKCNLTDHGTGVALIMRGPGGFTGGKVCDAMLSHIDLFPTICELAGAGKPAWLQGRSILPVIRGERTEIDSEVFAEVNYHAAYEPMRSVRTRRWKYIRRFDGRTRPVLPNCDDGLSKEIWLRYGWRERPVEAEQLFDLVFDPGETRNLAASPEHRRTLDDMRGRLDRWMRATGDPLLHGPVKAPAGAVVNDPDGVSPREAVHPAA